MAPIIQELIRRKIPFNLVDSGQHAGLTGDLRKQFNIPDPDCILRESDENISKLLQGIKWFLADIWKIITRREAIFQEVFQGKKGVCLIHGDTMTTLLSLFYAKRCGIKTAHVEAGLRSFHLLDPFPEEIIRLITMRMSDILFTPSAWANDNITKMNLHHKSVMIQGNTIIDAIDYALDKGIDTTLPDKPYVVVTIHRFETIFSRSRLNKLIRILLDIAERYNIFFVMHNPTKIQLLRYKLLDVIQNHPKISTTELLPYFEFINIIKEADFVITDGGSIQEETAYLNIPCIIMRSKTERVEGINKNAILCDFDIKEVIDFMNNLSSYLRSKDFLELRPSCSIVDYIIDNLEEYA